MRNVLAALCLVSVAAPALAQTPTMPTMPQAPGMGGQAEMMSMMHRAAYNQLGVLEFCQAQGNVGPDVIALQKRMIGMLPPAQVDGLDTAEAAGKRGVVQMGGNEVAIPDAAKAHGSTVQAMCKQMGDMLTAQAANLPK